MFDALILKPEVFGLDISDLSLKIAKLKKKNNFFRLATFGQAEVKPGLISKGEIQDIAALSETIKRALKNTKGEKLNTNYVIASLPEEKSFLQIIQLPKMNEEEIKKAVFFEAENYVPLPIDQVYLDFQPVYPLHGNIDHTDVLIAALPKKTVDPYLMCLKRAGLRPLALEIESQAVARALIKNGISEFPLLLIDFGALRTSFIIFSGSSLRFTTSIQVSSNTFTEAIAQNLKIGIPEAEKMKIEHGLGQKNSLIFQALIPSLTDLTEQIKKYLNYYQTHFFHDHLSPVNKNVKKILISGGGANLNGLADFLTADLNLPVEVSSPWVNILPENSKNYPNLPIEKASGLTTALGLALRGVKQNHD